MNLYSPTEQLDLDRFLSLSTRDIPQNIPVAHAVAVLALSNVQSRLPQCGIFDSDGVLTLTRTAFPNWQRDVVLFPQFLFVINWADSAPGISWPESYFVTYLPFIDRYIVTASMDSPDMWGVTDLAIGSFLAQEDLLTGSSQVISAWWLMQRDHGQPRFAYVWSEGRVSQRLAHDWADQVWAQSSANEKMRRRNV